MVKLSNVAIDLAENKNGGMELAPNGLWDRALGRSFSLIFKIGASSKNPSTNHLDQGGLRAGKSKQAVAVSILGYPCRRRSRFFFSLFLQRARADARLPRLLFGQSPKRGS